MTRVLSEASHGEVAVRENCDILTQLFRCVPVGRSYPAADVDAFLYGVDTMLRVELLVLWL